VSVIIALRVPAGAYVHSAGEFHVISNDMQGVLAVINRNSGERLPASAIKELQQAPTPAQDRHIEFTELCTRVQRFLAGPVQPHELGALEELLQRGFDNVYDPLREAIRDQLRPEPSNE
jgi:hypothetical protein